MRQAKKARRTIGIRGQLMWFLCFICLLLLGLFWYLSTQLLEPLYIRHIQTQLTAEAEQIVSEMDTAIANGDTLSYWAFGGIKVTDDAFFDALKGKLYENSPLSSFCVDISDSTLRTVKKFENLTFCNLHETALPDPDDEDIQYSTARAIRQYCRQTGGFVKTLQPPTPSGSRQLVVGRMTADGAYTVLVTTSLMHVSEAGEVMSTVLPLAAALIFAFSMSAAWLFSEWFTKPLRQLSAAARQVAQGNYAVHVENNRSDELGTLSQEFNHMAQEVQHAAQMQRDLLANVSHDLRTPLTLIKGYAETVRDLTGDDKAHRDEQMNIIVDEADRLTALVSSVMGAEQSDQRCGEVRAGPLRYGAALRRSQRAVRRALRPERLGAEVGDPRRGASGLRRPQHDAARTPQPVGQRDAPHRHGRAVLPAGIPLQRRRPGGSGRPRPGHCRRRLALHL